MALHLLQGGLGGETLFILEYAHAGRSVGGGELLSHCPAGALGLHFNKKKKKKCLDPKYQDISPCGQPH